MKMNQHRGVVSQELKKPSISLLQWRPQSSDGEAAASMCGLETWTTSIDSLYVDVDLFNDIYVLLIPPSSVLGPSNFQFS